MPNLSPDPSAETNALLRLIASRDSINGTIPQTNISADFSPQPAAIAANCLLYVSLCCSLLAAVGAMLGKEWLQSLDRTGQRGSLEEQGRIRQQKFSGVQQWHLEGTIVFLPNLLLLSVMFFFAGLSLFLIPINNVVAGTVIAFFALGATLAGATIVVGAISSSCPYQSAPSRALRGTLRYVRPLAGRWKESLLSRLGGLHTRLLHGRPGGRRHVIAGTTRPSAPNSSEKRSRIDAQAACWLLEMTSDPAEHLIVARNMCCLDAPACDAVLQDVATWRQLLLLTSRALQSWQEQPTEINKDIAESFGSAVCHLVQRRPRNDGKWLEVDAEFRRELFVSRHGPKLFQLEYVMRNGLSELPPSSNASYTLKKLILRTWIVGGKFPGWRLLAGVVREPYDDTILSLLALSIMWNFAEASCHIPLSRGGSHERSYWAWEAYNGCVNPKSHP